jgi:hypothetical protein
MSELEQQINEFMAEEFRKFILDALNNRELMSRRIEVPYLGTYKAVIKTAPRDENGILIEGTIEFRRD